MKKTILIQLFSLLFCNTIYRSQNTVMFQKCGTENLPQQFETWLQNLPPIIKPGKTGNEIGRA